MDPSENFLTIGWAFSILLAMNEHALGIHPGWIFLVGGVALACWIWRKKGFQRGAQVLSMVLFTFLFWLAAFGGEPTWPVGFFLFSDPLVGLVHALLSHLFLPLLGVSLLFVALALAMGRVFCSHVCPLGALFDFSDGYLGKRQKAKDNRERFKKARQMKFVFLAAILAAALAGFNLLGYGDPLVIFTRFAATLFYPALSALADVGLLVLRPLAARGGWVELAYLEVILPAFEGALPMLGLLVGLLLLSRFQPRFWCRHLCPLGALLGLVGRWAPYRRRVDASCNRCQRCVKDCPTGAIGEDGTTTDRSECITCLSCVRVCPQNSVTFGFQKADAAVDLRGVQLSRRMFLGGAAGGLGAGLAMRVDVLHPSNAFLPLPLRHQGLIRPPGALPEPAFLERCLRCGECLRACLTNTLQPDWHRAGLEGLWAPRMNLRHAACEQGCNVCGQVCPTQAIRPLSLAEKQHAKVGTAVVIRDRCLPWSQDRRCLICDEQCPYNAIVFQHDATHRMGLPVVNADKCNGCGQCEDKCPVIGEAAILVVPQGELRLLQGSYVAEARNLGLVFEAKGGVQDQFRDDSEPAPASPSIETPPPAPPDQPSGVKKPLPPGITPDEGEGG